MKLRLTRIHVLLELKLGQSIEALRSKPMVNPGCDVVITHQVGFC